VRDTPLLTQEGKRRRIKRRMQRSNHLNEITVGGAFTNIGPLRFAILVANDKC